MRRIGATFIRYLIVAVLAYLVDIGVFAILYHSGFASITSANMTGKVATAIFGFFAHRTITFRIKDNTGIAREALKYFTIALLYAPFTTGLLLLFVRFLPSTTIAKIAADTIGVLATFTVSKLFVFKQEPRGLDVPR